jgi:hypothetical protein
MAVEKFELQVRLRAEKMRAFTSLDDIWGFAEELIDQANRNNDAVTVALLRFAQGHHYHTSELAGEFHEALKVIYKKSDKGYLQVYKDDIKRAIKYLTKLINRTNRPW